ncbi:MAG TPA: TetR/AcrR family transcriptional regulator [Solirubrobacteraceae bacterium]|nr:TetR/AcrR family transcriptional regulator [Solirubrobacteraceae bacterium]
MSSDEPSPALPPGLDLLWGRRSKARRGPRAELSIEAIVRAAIKVADAEGLEAVSMGRVAKELGFTPMSLYRHLGGKEELLQLMWNASAEGAEHLVLEGDGWRERLLNWSLIQREMLDRHAWITQMPMAAPPMAPNSLHFVERGLEALDPTPLADADKLRIIGLISSYTLSEARMANDAARAFAAASAGEGVPPSSFEALLREFIDEATFPRLYRIATAGPPAPADADPAAAAAAEAEAYRWGLERILDGVQALINASGAG